MPGIGDMLGAEFFAATGGNMRRPRRYSRRLLRMFYLSAQVAAVDCPVSRVFYQRKRDEGKKHKQAVLTLARRRLNVLWALIRDGRTFETTTPKSAASAQ